MCSSLAKCFVLSCLSSVVAKACQWKAQPLRIILTMMMLPIAHRALCATDAAHTMPSLFSFVRRSTRQSNSCSLPLFVLCVRIKGPPNDNVQTSLVVPTGVSEGYSYFPHSVLTLTATGVGLPSIRGHTSTSHLWPRDHQRAANPHPHLCDATCVTSMPIRRDPRGSRHGTRHSTAVFDTPRLHGPLRVVE